MPDREKVIAWLADEELYYRDHGDTHNSLMACDALELLKELIDERHYYEEWKEGYGKQEIVRCKDCKYLIDHYGFMDDGYCENMRETYCLKFKPEDDWFCADGKRK